MHAAVGQQSDAGNPDQEMLTLLQKMVQEDPTRSDSWRLIGRIYQKQGDTAQAKKAFERALQEQADNIAAHSDLGDLLSDLGQSEAAAAHYSAVMSLGPESSYAAELSKRGFGNTGSSNAPSMADSTTIDEDELNSINLIGYEIQTFDGADDLDRILDVIESDTTTPTDRFRAVFEVGTLYNTNLSLTPISRSLRTGDGASAQLFISPSLEWIAFDNGRMRVGPLGRGYFTFNESNFDSLNLASFQPGLFVERDFEWADHPLIGRVDYVYSTDFLGGDHFGDRHSVTASLTAILPDSDAIYSYFTTSFADFTEDGVTPSVESLDGPAYTAGVSRFFTTESKWIPAWSLGADLEHAATRGADFRYSAANLHTDVTIQLNEKLSLIPKAGVGYRHYPDFTGAVDRDETTWRVGARLRWQCTKLFSVSAIVGYDRFASDNEEFDTDRTEAGIVFTFTH
ncbi:putative PEP-CTERM system TPR-repeat lipoprotein [Fuerstiella marisgermanici]|uniref:Putative PEP-CTERM system TPR-repeat lipoprotein n=2 Tax=Fuerstiella marisgermanici TaxID=1891926 RepID=A0A1P8WJ41_9PLAN|nr:putative PEP-CTERM system TPR-repeat lipoprotein [Fuerstiella marisgermanici]